MRPGVVLRCVLLLLGPRASVALAEPARDAVVEVYAPPGAECVTAARLRAEVEARVDSVVFLDARRADRRIEVRVERDARGVFSALIRVLDTRGESLGERTVPPSASCDELERSLVIVLSTLIGLARNVPAPERRPEPQPEPPPRATDATDAAPPPEAPAAASGDGAATAPGFGLALLAEGTSGLLPGVAPLAALALYGRYGRLELRLTASWAPGWTQGLGEQAAARFSGVFGELDVCGLPVAQPALSFALCAGAQAGALHAESRGLTVNARQTRPVVRVALRASLQLAVLEHHAVVLGLGAAVPALSQRFGFVERGEMARKIYSVELGFLAEIGWLWRFGS